jgi:hypothetical protein
VVRSLSLCLVLWLLLASGAVAHPSSGIVVDPAGKVYFSDTTRGVLRIEPDGAFTRIHAEGGHWLALDPLGGFSHMDFEKSPHWPRWFKRRTPSGTKPALLTDGGSPLVVHRDGNLYYVCNDERMIPGGLTVARLSRDGKLELVSRELAAATERLGGIKGLASGPGMSLYAACPGAILRIGLDGSFTTLAQSLSVEGCDRHLPPDTPKSQEPYLRGLDVAPDGTVYAAATGCRALLSINPKGEVKSVLKAERPWAPTGVSAHDGEVFVLEYTDPDSPTHENWKPRVRKLDRDGKVTTLFTVRE